MKITKTYIKDVLQLLGISILILVVIFLVSLLFKSDKGAEIYVRDENGNYVLDQNGKAITKQEQCYKDRDLGVAIGYGDTTGHCTIDGRWVDSE